MGTRESNLHIMHKKKLVFLAVALLDSNQNIGFSVFLQWPVYVIGISWLNCRIPCHLKATPKDRWICGYSVTTYPRIRVAVNEVLLVSCCEGLVRLFDCMQDNEG